MNILVGYLSWVKKEIIKIFPAFVYFVIAFNLIFFINGLIPNPDHVRYFNYWSVTLGAAIAAKALLIADVLPFLNIFRNKPLIFNIVWKLLVYMLVVLLLWIIETVIDLEDAYRNMHTVMKQLRFDFHTPTFWTTLIWLTITFLIFTVACEFIEVIGKHKVNEWLFGKAPDRMGDLLE